MAVKKFKKASTVQRQNNRPEDHRIDDENEDPDVEDIESEEICKDNKATCINDNIDGVLEVFDEITCRDMLIGYYEVASEYIQIYWKQTGQDFFKNWYSD